MIYTDLLPHSLFFTLFFASNFSPLIFRSIPGLQAVLPGLLLFFGFGTLDGCRQPFQDIYRRNLGYPAYVIQFPADLRHIAGKVDIRHLRCRTLSGVRYADHRRACRFVPVDPLNRLVRFSRRGEDEEHTP